MVARGRLLPAWAVQRRLLARLGCAGPRSRRNAFCFLLLLVVLAQLVFLITKGRVPAGTASREHSRATGGSARASTRTLPTQVLQGEGGYFRPGQLWLDMDGNPIHAHGGGVLYDEGQSTYFWYGQHMAGDTERPDGMPLARVAFSGISCYRSKDLLHWQYVGVVLKSEPKVPDSDLHPSRVCERPKVIYNDISAQYVMWMHIDDAKYELASLGVAVSDYPEGPFKYLGRQRPHNSDSRDMTVFKDDDGTAYVVYSTDMNSNLHIGRLSNDYLRMEGAAKTVLNQLAREAPAVFKHNKFYFLVTSGCTGWAPNAAMVHVANSMLGTWQALGDPCLDDDLAFRRRTFNSQGTFVLPVAGSQGTFIFMADTWKEHNLTESRYVWLPLEVSTPMPGQISDCEDASYRGRWRHKYICATVKIRWHAQWQLPSSTKE